MFSSTPVFRNMAASKISVVTVAHNAGGVIENTLRSVIFQTYPSVEYIVIDMRSRDQTLEIVKNYSQHITYWMSQTCENRFDAMNAGLQKCTGDYVLFLNAGHCLKTLDTLAQCLMGADGADLIYAPAIYADKHGATRAWHKQTPGPGMLSKESFINGLVVCPACMLVRRALTPAFSVGPWRFVNDLDWAIRVVDAVKSIHYYPEYLCLYRDRHVSPQKRFTILKERFDICRRHFGLFRTLLEQFRIAFQAIRRRRIS